MTDSTFTSTYTMEELAADTHAIDHDKMNRRYAALVRLGRIKNGRVWRESFSSPAETS